MTCDLMFCVWGRDEEFEELEKEAMKNEEEVRSLEAEKRSVEAQVVTLTTDLATSRARVAELEQANWARQRQRRQRRMARRNADCTREQAEMKEAWDAEQPIAAEQDTAQQDAAQQDELFSGEARLAELCTTEQEATRVVESQARYWEELLETDSEEVRRVAALVVEEQDALLERMLSGMEV
jgi:hypothetical protein